jgi:signal transduction histidine kinase
MNPKLAAVIMHDIKNALGVLEGELLQMTSEPSRERAVSAHGNCAMLRERLVGFLTLYKASSQGLRAQIEAVSPQDFLRALLRDRLSTRPEIGISINAHGMPVLGFFDENLVGLALEAALQNATRFARSSVEIGCFAEEGGGLVFTVRDDGPGLGAKEEKPSTGLGMELCLAIAQAHRKGDGHGSVSLQDHPEGGAVFVLHLP